MVTLGGGEHKELLNETNQRSKSGHHFSLRCPLLAVCFFSVQFIVLTYVLAALWLLVFALSALPVYFFYNMNATCSTIEVLTETPASINQLCVDARQYGNKESVSMATYVNIHAERIVVLKDFHTFV